MCARRVSHRARGAPAAWHCHSRRLQHAFGMAVAYSGKAGCSGAPGKRITATPPLATRRRRMAEAAGIPVEELGLFTDLYQLTMAQSDLEHDKNRPATFSLIVRKYPPEHSYLVAAGLATVLEYLEQVRFSPRA